MTGPAHLFFYNILPNVPNRSGLVQRVFDAPEASMRQAPNPSTIPVLSVRTEDGRTFAFSHPFQIGRDHDCEVRIEDAQVSRHHATVAFEDGRWLLRDALSANGVFVDGRRVETVSIETDQTIRLGAAGPRAHA